MELKELIGELGGQAQFARRFGIPYRTVQNWYRGERNPPEHVVHMLQQLAQKTEEARRAQNHCTEAYTDLEYVEEQRDELINKIAELEKRIEWLELERDAYKWECEQTREEYEAIKGVLYKK